MLITQYLKKQSFCNASVLIPYHLIDSHNIKFYSTVELYIIHTTMNIGRWK